MGTRLSTNPHVNAAPIEGDEYIYHITRKADWLKGLAAGIYQVDSLETEGFIHCSRENQVAGSANRYFSGATGLVVLKIRTNRLASRLVYEASTPGDYFPHIYGPLNTDAVADVIPFEPAANGVFNFPG